MSAGHPGTAPRRTGALVTAALRTLLALFGAGAVSGFALHGRDRQVCRQLPAWVVVVVTVPVAALLDAGLIVPVQNEMATGRWRWRLTFVTPLHRRSGKYEAEFYRWKPDVGRASAGALCVDGFRVARTVAPAPVRHAAPRRAAPPT